MASLSAEVALEVTCIPMVVLKDTPKEAFMDSLKVGILEVGLMGTLAEVLTEGIGLEVAHIQVEIKGVHRIPLGANLLGSLGEHLVVERNLAGIGEVALVLEDTLEGLNLEDTLVGLSQVDTRVVGLDIDLGYLDIAPS